jgi:tRNA 5-methylaminomethyl-2-thiouridine biosynthesis bifunctional protein
MTEGLDWLSDGGAYSPRFHERYSSCTGGVAQALAVFLGGCDLPQRWRGRDRFTVLETGFGLGLNFLSTWATWEADPQRCGSLHFVSVEGFPVAAADLLRNLARVGSVEGVDAPQLARIQALGQELAAAWSELSAGLNHFEFAQGQVHLTVAVDAVQPALASLSCVADAVFLDGFSPAVNPEMWSHDTLAAVAAHAQAGTVLATYTVARAVRDTLAALGFSVSKHKGLPPKRDRLRAVFLG